MLEPADEYPEVVAVVVPSSGTVMAEVMYDSFEYPLWTYAIWSLAGRV